MSTMIAEVYDALKEAGVSEEKARAASTAIADKESLSTKEDLLRVQSELKQEINDVKGEMRVLKWMLGVLIAGIASLILKAFFM